MSVYKRKLGDKLADVVQDFAETVEQPYWAARRRYRNRKLVRAGMPPVFAGHELRWYEQEKGTFHDFKRVACYFDGGGAVWLELSFITEPRWTFVWGMREFSGPVAPLDAIADFLAGPDYDVLAAYLKAEELSNLVDARFRRNTSTTCFGELVVHG